MYVSQLSPGDKFETVSGQSYELLYNVGDMRSYVRSLSKRHVTLASGAEFDVPGERVNISTGTEVERMIND